MKSTKMVISVLTIGVMVFSPLAIAQAYPKYEKQENITKSPQSLKQKLISILNDPTIFDVTTDDFTQRLSSFGTAKTDQKTDTLWTFLIPSGESSTGCIAFFEKMSKEETNYPFRLIILAFDDDDNISVDWLYQILNEKFGSPVVFSQPGSNQTFTWKVPGRGTIEIATDIPGTTNPIVYGVTITRAY